MANQALTFPYEGQGLATAATKGHEGLGAAESTLDHFVNMVVGEAGELTIW